MYLMLLQELAVFMPMITIGEFIYQNTVVQNNLIHHAHLYDVKKFIF